MQIFEMMMIGGGGFFLVFGVLFVVNFVTMARGMMNAEGSFDRAQDSMRKGIVGHLVFPLLAGMGGLVLLAGFIWFLIERFSGQ